MCKRFKPIVKQIRNVGVGYMTHSSLVLVGILGKNSVILRQLKTDPVMWCIKFP